MPRTNPAKFMNSFAEEPIITEEKARLYDRLHEQMYAESIRQGRTPIPDELKDPQEWDAFCHWKHLNWLRIAQAAAADYVQSLRAEGKLPRITEQSSLALAETPPPYPSKN